MLADMFTENYIGLVEVSIDTGVTQVLKSSMDKGLEDKPLLWDDLLRQYAQRTVHADDRHKLDEFSLKALQELMNGKKTILPFDLRCLGESGQYDWIEVTCKAVSSDGRQLLFMMRNVNEDHILRKIVELFVFRNFDYFILIDSQNDTYTTFNSAGSGAPIPPVNPGPYTETMVSFNEEAVAPEDVHWVIRNMQLSHVLEMLEKEGTYGFTCGMILEDGSYYRARVQFVYYDKAAGLILLTRTDVTSIYAEEMRKNRQLAAALREAQHDALTDLFNKKATVELVTKSMDSQYRTQAAVLFVDVDNFKLVNDTLGHQRGDEMLQFLAHCLQKAAGKDGLVGRIGGDEFLVYLPSVIHIDEIKTCAEQICSAFELEKQSLADNLPVSCSAGISVYPHDGTDYETLVNKADQALYTAKRYGKNQYTFYSENRGVVFSAVD